MHKYIIKSSPPTNQLPTSCKLDALQSTALVLTIKLKNNREKSHRNIHVLQTNWPWFTLIMHYPDKTDRPCHSHDRLQDELNLNQTVTKRWKLLSKKDKLCAWRHNMPPPRTLRPTSSPQPTRLMPCAMNIHDRQAAARWHRDWSRRYTLCSDFNSQQSGLVTSTF